MLNETMLRNVDMVTVTARYLFHQNPREKPPGGILQLFSNLSTIFSSALSGSSPASPASTWPVMGFTLLFKLFFFGF